MKNNKELVILAGKASSGPSGAGGVFVVTFSYASSAWQTDHTFAEVEAAEAAGKTILFKIGEVMSSVVKATDGGETYYKGVAVDSDRQMYSMWLSGSGFPPDATVTIVELAKAEKSVNISGSTPSITPEGNTTYKCGEVSSLTISNPPATGAYSIVFTSGSTATSTTIPSTILGLESFAAEANTMYEINVLDNRAVVGSWAVSA